MRDHGAPEVLWVTPDSPVPATFGGAVFTTAITTGLAAAGARVVVIARAPRTAGMAGAAAATYGIDELEVFPRRARLSALATLARHPRWPLGAAVRWSRAMAAAIAARRAHLGVLELSSVIPYLDALAIAAPRVAFCVQNLQSVTQQSIATQLRGPARLAWLREARASRGLEDRLARDGRVARFLVINERERDILADRYPDRRGDLVLLPVPFQAGPLPDGQRDPEAIVFVGTLDYPPNVDAARWLCTAVLPRVRAARPATTCLLVGRRPSPALREMAEQAGARIMADVPDVSPFLCSAAVAAVPVRTGGGVKIKLLEAVANGAPVVATRSSLEGTVFAHPSHLLAADSADEFAAACLAVLQDPTAAGERAARAHELLLRRHGPEGVGRALLQACA